VNGPDVFRSRVATDVVPVAQRDPAAFDNGLAEGAAQIGNALEHVAAVDQHVSREVAASQQRIALELQKRQRSAQVAQGASAWAEIETGLDADRAALRDSSAPGAPDHIEKANTLITDRLKGFLDTLPADPEVRERFEPIVARYGATARHQEDEWARASKAKFEGQNVESWADTTGNGLITTPTPEKLQQAFQATDLLVGALDIPGTAKAAIIAQKKRAFSQAFLDGRLQAGDWKGARALLDAGQFDAYLDPKEKTNYLQRTENAADQAAREAELAQSRVRDDARDAIKTVEAKVEAGVVPSAAELRATRQAATAAGLDPQDIVKLDALDVKVDVNRSYSPMIGQPGGADRIRRDRDLLAGRIMSGKASERDQMAKAQLDKLVETADKAEAEQLKTVAGQGPQGELQALSMLTGSADGRYSKAEKIKPGLGLMALLAPNARKAAIEGDALRKGRGDDFGKEEQIRQQVNAQLGPVANEIGLYPSVVKAAGDIMASFRVMHGGTGIDPDDLKKGLKLATGGSVRPDGRVQGGLGRVRGHPVLLPDWLTDSEFDAALSRQDFSNAVYANGSPVSKDDILARYRPKFAGDDAQGNARYHFVDPAGNLLGDKGNSPVVLTFKH